MKEKGNILGRIFKGDSVIWVIMVILSAVSTLAVYSATGLLAYKFQHGHTAHYVLRHTGMLLLGWGVMWLAHRIRYTKYAKGNIIALFMVLLLLAYTLTLGSKVNDANRWIRIFGVSFQPSELAKVVLIIFMAYRLTKYHENIDTVPVFWRLIWAPALTALLILPANLSTAFLLALTCFVMMFAAGVNKKCMWGTVGTGAGLAAVMLALFFLVPQGKLPGRAETWRNRIVNYSSDEAKGSDAVFQVEHAKMAVAGGRVLGKGPGNSTQRNFLPHPYSDYVYALIIEEYGMVSGVLILFLYLIFLRRGIQIARNSKGTFGRYLALGITFMISVQAMVNMGVAVGLLPVTGQPLPFVSMGGTSILFTAFALGMLQSVARVNNESREV